MTFGEYLRQCRKNKKLTIKQTAPEIGLSASYLSGIENGKRSAPSFEILQKLADLLKLTPEERYRLYDLAAESKQPPALADDLNAYIYQYPAVRDMLRCAMEYRLTENDWDTIVAYITKNYFY